MGGRSVLLIPAGVGDGDPDVPRADYQRLLVIVREAAGPVTVRQVGGMLGLPAEVRRAAGIAVSERGRGASLGACRFLTKDVRSSDEATVCEL